jgi:hypothetical protein
MKTKYIWIFIAVVAAIFSAIYLWPHPIGYIKIDAGVANAALLLRSSLVRRTTVTSGALPVTVGAKSYYPEHLLLTGEQSGDKYQIVSKGPWGQLTIISVKKDETTALKLGPPLLVKPNVTSRGSLVLIDFSIIGQADEQYGNVITKNGRTASTPELKIIDEAGNTLAAGKFEYG